MADLSRTILVVEPDQDTALCLKLVLEMAGFTVVTAANSPAAVKAALESNPDLIITDIEVGPGNALSMIEKMRNVPILRATPILVHATLPDHVTITDCFRAGANLVIRKPVAGETILRVIESILK